MTNESLAIACFGEVVMRLSVPKGELPLQTPRFDAFVGGAEANVAVALAALGRTTRMISALPPGPIGDGVLGELRRFGVDTRTIRRSEGRLGFYYHVPGGAMRPSEVLYDRAGSAFAEHRAEDWDWEHLLAGTRWLHVSGVTPALGPKSASATLGAVRAARKAGIGISFDGNWRGRLWERWDCKPAEILSEIIAEADVLFGNHRDATLLLGRDFSGDGEDRRREAALAMLGAFPGLTHVASTARHIVGEGEHHLVARIDTRDEAASTDALVVTPVIDRVGTGDAFAAGVLDGLLSRAPLHAAASRGLAVAALKHGLRGDLAPFSASQVDKASPVAADVMR